MKNIHVLPTDKEDFVIFKNRHLGGRLFHWNMDLGNPMNRLNYIGQNIYITNSEEIKEGDWFLNDMNILFKAGKNYIENPAKEVYIGHKKIILTTDQDLIKDGVQAIPDEFLEWFVKNPTCEYVEVEIESKFDRLDGHYHDVWEIIIPKEETLEEAKKYAELSYYGDEVDAFVRGAKWQAKRMYSEEEVKYMLQSYAEWSIDGDCTYYEWFEKFKKK